MAITRFLLRMYNFKLQITGFIHNYRSLNSVYSKHSNKILTDLHYEN